MKNNEFPSNPKYFTTLGFNIPGCTQFYEYIGKYGKRETLTLTWSTSVIAHENEFQKIQANIHCHLTSPDRFDEHIKFPIKRYKSRPPQINKTLKTDLPVEINEILTYCLSFVQDQLLKQVITILNHTVKIA